MSSPRYIVGDTVVMLWTILDLSSDPLTGMTSPADITFTLHRESGSAMVLASETVTFAEIGSTGHYTVSFAPENAGVYVLQLKELNVSTFQRTYRFEEIEVFSSGSEFSPAYANAFCNEADIERWIQTAIDSTTSPDDTEASAFAETRAAILMSLCGKWGFIVTPATVVSGSIIEDLLRRANAIGAALDYSLAQQYGVRPSQTNRIDALQALWVQMIGDSNTTGVLEGEVRGNLVSLSSNHILSGDTTAYTEPVIAPISQPIGVGMGDEF